MPELLSEAAAVAEEVAAAGEIAGSAVDLTTISQQLDQIMTWQMALVFSLAVIAGIIIGVAVARVIGRTWR